MLTTLKNISKIPHKIVHAASLACMIVDMKQKKIDFRQIPGINGRPMFIHDNFNMGGGKSRKTNIIFGKNVFINSGFRKNPIGRGICTVFRTINDGEIIIGDNVKMSNTVIVSMKKISIGNNVMIGGGVTIWDTDFHSLDYRKRMFCPYEDINTSGISIGDGVFIGAGTYIMKGVHIGTHSIIGAGSVVTSDVPDYEIWAGNPARFIRKVRE